MVAQKRCPPRRTNINFFIKKQNRPPGPNISSICVSGVWILTVVLTKAPQLQWNCHIWKFLYSQMGIYQYFLLFQFKPIFVEWRTPFRNLFVLLSIIVSFWLKEGILQHLFLSVNPSSKFDASHFENPNNDFQIITNNKEDCVTNFISHVSSRHLENYLVQKKCDFKLKCWLAVVAEWSKVTCNVSPDCRHRRTRVQIQLKAKKINFNAVVKINFQQK